MKFTLLTPALCVLLLASCAKKDLAGEEEPTGEVASTANTARTPDPAPVPLKENPFAVPDVTNNLPDDEDLQPSPSAPTTLVPGSEDADAGTATVTARPTAEDASADSAE